MNEVETYTGNLDEKANELNEMANELKSVTNDLGEVIAPFTGIEDKLMATNQEIGAMALDTLYMPENKVFIEALKGAIQAHSKWLQSLEDMVAENKVRPLQTRHQRCGFGHFYYSVKPQNPLLVSKWEALEEEHKRFHNYGRIAITAIKEGKQSVARDNYDKAYELTKTLLAEFQAIVDIAEDLDKQNIRVFEA
jgi:hypothetical protein